MLSVTYLLIIFFVLLLLMVVFFLPLLLAGMRAVGLGHRIPQPRIRPSTAKIPQNEVEKVTKLVYYLPEEVVAAPSKPRSSLDDLRVGEGEASIPGTSQDTTEASGVMLPPSRPPTPAARRSEEQSTSSTEPSKPTVTLTEEPAQLAGAGWKRFAGAVLPRRRRKVAAATTTKGAASEAAGTNQLKYPLLRIPAHRATCPICLCDFEPPDLTTASPATTDEPNDEQAAPPAEPEVLRLLPCGHVLHASCVDQWLTTVSARCPVCQRKLVVETPGNNATDEEEQ